MGGFLFSTPVGDRPLEELLTQLPLRIRKMIKEGFSLLAKLSDDNTRRVLDVSVRSLGPSEAFKVGDLASELGLTPGETKTLLSGASFVVATLSSTGETPEKFVDTAKKAGLLSAVEERKILDFSGAAAKERGVVREAMERTSTATQLLPSLETFDTTVDIRLGFQKGRIAIAVPVVLVHLGTDAAQNEIWFQVTEGQLKMMVADLQEALGRIEEAKHWLAKSPPGKD